MDDEYPEHEQDVERACLERDAAWHERNSPEPEKRQDSQPALKRLNEAGQRFADYLN